jgi:threonine dehydrogenase-like Zn-dependent dehydrogenase
MKAITIRPGVPDSAELADMPEPDAADGAILVQGLAMGVCGTDAELLSGAYGEAPQGTDRLIIGHESLGRVLDAPADAPVRAGDLVVGIVRRPDPLPCPCCAVGQWDMCRNGRYTERGIKGRHGYGAERWRIEPEFCVKLDPGLDRVGVLLEPATILAKAWANIEYIAHRACFGGERVLVTGAGPVGLMGALMAVQRGLETHVIDLATSGPKPELVRALGASYHGGADPADIPRPDIVIECTGVPQVIVGAIRASGPNGITCLTGLSSTGRQIAVDLAKINMELVLQNDVVFGSVNANRAHYERAADALAIADDGWLERVITRRVPLQTWHEALRRHADDVKVVVDLAPPA